jgi:oleandomycin transport system permease protein
MRSRPRGWSSALLRASPRSDLATATRGLITGGPVAGAAVKSALWALGIVVVFAPLAVRVYQSKS